ncbi:putative MFS permease [Magnetofaba australis IT-1]|uniref:Bcr/CflA family efflux transporter n=2 Tax=Magnetofaba TaxID=1472292 RepID=A0A1Y2K986_9PROT|nr:putative MFS permease [Magnetofaba australis IT-1]
MLLLITALGPASTQVFLPALPAIQADFGVTAGIAQLGLSLPMLGMAFSDLGYGPWSDKAGRRKVLLFGVFAFLLGNAICFTAQDIALLIAGRVLMDCGGSVGIVLSRAIALDVYGRDKAGGIISMTLAAMAVGPMLGPLAGGVLVDTLGWRAIFVFMASIGLGILLYVHLRFRETHSSRATDASLGDVVGWFKDLLRSRTFLGYALHSSLMWGVFMGFIGAAPYVMVNVFERPATEFGLWLIPAALGYIGGNMTSARLSESHGVARLVVLGAAMALAAVVLLGVLMGLGLWSPWALFLPATVMAFGAGVAIPNAQAAAVDAIPAASGSASGLIGFLMMVIGAGAAQLVAMLQSDTPYPMVGVMAALMLLAAAALLIREK